MLARLGIAVFLFVVSSSNVSADSVGEWRLSVEGSMFTVDSSVRSTQGLGQSGGGLDLATVYYFVPKMAVKLGFGFIGIDDDLQYSQPVISNFGDTDTFSSSVSATNFFGEFFYQTPLRHKSIVGYRVGAGYSFFADAERSVSRCVNCQVDNLRIDSGLYLTAGMYFYYSSRGKLGLSGRHYLLNDIGNGVVLWWEMLGRK